MIIDIEALNKFDKIQQKRLNWIYFCIFLGAVSLISIFLGFDYAVIGLLPIPFILIGIQVDMLNKVGLV